MQTLADIGEDALIQRLVKHLPQRADVLVGPGDDCAVVRAAATDRDVLLKADAVVEGVHFQRDAEPRLIGRKAMARAISDIGAMGGTPRHALITLVLRQDLTVDFVEAMYEGMSTIATEFNVSIVGGETSRGEQIVISVSMIGDVPAGASPLRSGGNAGDVLLVTGLLGGSITGRHFTFQPRVQAAQWLCHNYRPTAMMDLSDGLAKDLPRLAGASRCDYVIDEAALPCAPGCTAAQAWGDGEDYELLIAIPSDQADALQQAWSEAFRDLPLTRIGQLVAQGQGRHPSFASTGWDHFAVQ